MKTPNSITLEGIKIIATGPEVEGAFGDTVRPLVCVYEYDTDGRPDQIIIWQKRSRSGEWVTTPGSDPRASENLLLSLLTA